MNRESAKWAPFESLFKSKDFIEEYEAKLLLHPKPVLSDYELLELETSLLDAYHTQEKVCILYYYKGRDYQKIGIIRSISQNKVYFLDSTSLYLDQILKIKEANF